MHPKIPITKDANLTEKAKMLQGFAYNPKTDLVLAEERHKAREICVRYNETEGKEEGRDENPLRFQLLTQLFGTCSPGTYIEPPFRCDYGYNIHVGDKFYANFGCAILDSAPVTIGKGAYIGPGSLLMTSTLPLCEDERSTGLQGALPIVIGDNVWLGGKTVVLPGVTIGHGSVIGANSVVTGDVPPMAVYAGNPAKLLHYITDKDSWPILQDMIAEDPIAAQKLGMLMVDSDPASPSTIAGDTPMQKL